MKKYSILQMKSINFAILFAIIFAFISYNNGFATQNLRDIAARQESNKGLSTDTDIFITLASAEVYMQELERMLETGELSVKDLLELQDAYVKGRIGVGFYAAFLDKVVKRLEYLKKEKKSSGIDMQLGALAKSLQISLTNDVKRKSSDTPAYVDLLNSKISDGVITEGDVVELEKRYLAGEVNIDNFVGLLVRIDILCTNFIKEGKGSEIELAMAVNRADEIYSALQSKDKGRITIKKIRGAAPDILGGLNWQQKQELAKKSFSELAGEAAESVKPTKPKVLVIDDDPGILQVFEVMLKESYTVETAKNGQEGVDKFEGGSFDLVITDMNTLRAGGHKDDGYRVATALKGKVPVVLMSGNGEEALAEAAVSGLFADIISKPISVKSLRDKVRNVLARSQSGIEEKLKAAIPVLAYTPKTADLAAGATMAAIVDAEIIAQSAPEAKLALAKLDEIVGKRNIRVLDLSGHADPKGFLKAANLSIEDFQIVITASDLITESKLSGIDINDRAQLIVRITERVLWALKYMDMHTDLHPHIQEIVGGILINNPQFADMVKNKVDTRSIYFGAIVPTKDAEKWRKLAGELILTILACDIDKDQGYASFAEAAVGLGEAIFNGREVPPHIVDMTNARLQKKDGYISLAPRSTFDLGTELQKTYADSRKALESV